MQVLAVIPARGGSKGIPRKNIAPLAGKPLIAWTIEAALASSSITRVVVSTDDAEIAQIAGDHGAKVVIRPEHLARDDTPTLPVIQHAHKTAAAEGFAADIVATLQPTSPLRTAEHIDEAVRLLNAHENATCLVSVQAVPHQFFAASQMVLHDGRLASLAGSVVVRRQDKPRTWARNGAAIYLTRAQALAGFIWEESALGFEMGLIDSIDIDGPEDLELAEAAMLYRQRNRSD